MEGAMRWHESDVLRVAAIGGATVALMVAVLFASPFYTTIAGSKVPVGPHASQTVANQKPAVEMASIVPSPAIDTNGQFFFGSGDGSNGYYAEQSEAILGLVRYAQMP
jgi:hypothetical protein